MTVGQQLAARTGFQLYHNHQVIDLLAPYSKGGKVGLFGSCSGGRHAVIYASQRRDVDVHDRAQQKNRCN